MIREAFKRFLIIVVSAGALVVWQFFGLEAYKTYLTSHGMAYDPAMAWLTYIVLMVIVSIFMFIGLRSIEHRGAR